MRSPRLWYLAPLVALLFIVACSQLPGSSAEPTLTPTKPPADTQPPPTEEPTVEPTAEPMARELPATSVTAVLGVDPQTTYKVNINTFEPIAFEDAELPVPPGSVEAHWYRSAGSYVVAYIGLDPSAVPPLCPGNSILTDQGFESVSNAPTEEGACDGFATLTSEPGIGPRQCQGQLLYVTAIPSDRQGTLYGTIEMLADEGTAIIGLTSTAMSTSDMPEIDLAEFCP